MYWAPGQAVEVVVSERLGVAPWIGSRDGGRGAEIGDRADIGNGIEVVGEGDEPCTEGPVPRLEPRLAKPGVVVRCDTHSVAVIHLPALSGWEVVDRGDDIGIGAAAYTLNQSALIKLQAHFVVVRKNQAGDPIEWIVVEAGAEADQRD